MNKLRKRETMKQSFTDLVEMNGSFYLHSKFIDNIMRLTDTVRSQFFVRDNFGTAVL